MTTAVRAAPKSSRRGAVDPRLLRYAHASRGFFVAIGVIGAAQTLVIVAFAWLLTRAITGVIDAAPWPETVETLGWLAAVVGARALLVWLRELVAARASARVQTQLRANLVEAVGTLGPGWLATRNTAQLAVTAGRGLDALDAYFSRYLPQLVQTFIATPVLVVVMWWQDWISGLTVLLTLPLIPIFMILIGLATRAVQRRQWETLHLLAARFADTVRGMSTLKVFGRQSRAAASIEKVTDSYRHETMKVLRVSFLSGFALELIASLSVAIIAVSIGFRLLDGALALSIGLFVLLLAPEAYLPLRQVGVQFHASAEGVAASDGVFEVLDAAQDASSREPIPSSPIRSDSDGRASSNQDEPSRAGDGDLDASGDAALVLRDVRVHHGDRMLGPVDLAATPGTVTLIEGPSGSGKTSLLAVLRAAASYEGTATYRGVDVHELAPSTWLAWAGQHPGLVAGTVRDNVTLGDDAPEGALVRRALELAHAGSLDPERSLGVQGAGLSGGQAQRVAVARAFYRHLRGLGPVIALDEPSAALDAETERRLWASVRGLADAGATVVLVSHRKSARQIADAIVRLAAREAQSEVTG